MKSLITFLLISNVFTLADIEHYQKIVDTVNNLKTTWTAKLNHREFAPLIDTLRETPEIQLTERTQFKTPNENLPDSYDLREAYPQCESVNEIKDDSQCPASWAFGAIETMNDRICIHSKGQLQTRLSILYLVSCLKECGGSCIGGCVNSFAFQFWKNNGIPTGGPYGDTNTCKPYFLPPYDGHMDKLGDNDDPVVCDNKCQDGYPKTVDEDKYYASKVYSVRGEENMMKEIYENGSVEGSFTVYEDFVEYNSGIYQHITGESLGGTCIKIIGWGISETGIKYWIVANSWGVNWGEKGFFRIVRGNNECGIENLADTGIPKL